jgi:hypothetical protein
MGRRAMFRRRPTPAGALLHPCRCPGGAACVVSRARAAGVVAATVRVGVDRHRPPSTVLLLAALGVVVGTYRVVTHSPELLVTYALLAVGLLLAVVYLLLDAFLG